MLGLLQNKKHELDGHYDSVNYYASANTNHEKCPTTSSMPLVWM